MQNLRRIRPISKSKFTSQAKLSFSLPRYSARAFVQPTSRIPGTQAPRTFHSSSATSANKEPFTNILADDFPPAVQVNSISPSGIQLTDGLIIPGACIFLEGKVFLWDPPRTFWEGWAKEHFDVFEVVVPKPEILLLGTGKTIFQPPPFIREHLNKMGIQLDVMDTRNACSTYNLLNEEGRRVAAALLPLVPRTWQKAQIGSGSK